MAIMVETIFEHPTSHMNILKTLKGKAFQIVNRIKTKMRKAQREDAR